MSDYVQRRFIITVDRRERVKTEGGFTTRALPSTQEEVLVVADLEAIAKALGPRAVRAKGRKARYGGCFGRMVGGGGADCECTACKIRRELA